MIKWSVTICLPVSYFYDFHYFCCRRHCFCWHSRALTQVQHTGSKFLYYQVVFLNTVVWQKQREVKPKLLTHCRQEQRWVWSAAREFLSGPMFTIHSHSAQSSLNCNLCSSWFLSAVRASGNPEHRTKQPTDISSILQKNYNRVRIPDLLLIWLLIPSYSGMWHHISYYLNWM